MDRYCFRCDDKLNRPHAEYANYIQGTDTTSVEKREGVYAMYHTKETKKELNKLCEKLPERDRQALAAEMAHPEAPDTIETTNGTEIVENEGGATETAAMEEIRFSIDEKLFRHVHIDSPNVVQDDDEVAFTYSILQDTEVQKTGLVCRDCVRPNEDEIIWGADDS